jgi:hypothetical protein
MIVIMDMASGEWTADGTTGEDPVAPPPRTPDTVALPRLALQEASCELPVRRKLPYDFPSASALRRLLKRQ